MGYLHPTKRHKRLLSEETYTPIDSFGSFLWLLFVRQEKDGERGEPVFTGVVAAGDVGKSGGCVFVGGGRQDLPDRIACRKRGRDASHAPRAAEIQTIEMHELRIAAIRNDRGLQQRYWSTLRDVR